VHQPLGLCGADEPPLRIEAHGVWKDGWVAVHHPGGHADDRARREEVVGESVARAWNNTREPADDAEGEAKAFFDDSSLHVLR